MEKISSQKVASVLSTVPGMLRSLAQERDALATENGELKEKVAEYQHRERVDNIAKIAASRDIDGLGETHEDKVASIEEAIERGKSLDVMEEAVKMSSPRGEIGSLSGDELSAGQGQSQLEAYLLGEG